MADSNPHDKARKRPLVGKENYDAPASPALNTSMKEKLTPVRSNPYATKKPRPGPLVFSEAGDVEVISPPPQLGASSVPKEPENLTGNETNDDCAIAWSNASNPCVEYTHGRPHCGVHDFHGGDKLRFCSKCYCVVCDTPASECLAWETHCHEEPKRPPPRQGQQDHSVIDVEDSMSLESDAQDDWVELEAAMMQQGRGNPKYDNHYTNDFNHAYDNRGGTEKGRNPKTMRITEILAIKMAEALNLSDKPKNPTNMNSSNTAAGDDQNSSSKKTAAEDFTTQQLQRKDRFNRSQMQGDIAQLSLHKSFFVEGVRIGWPYPSILLPQRQMAIHLVKALKNSRHVVLESPTGTGKSAVRHLLGDHCFCI
jgi:hypothetical protein